MQNHGFVGQRMVSGLYISEMNPKHNIDNAQEFQKLIKRRVSMIFGVYVKLEICQKHGKNTVKINGNKLKEFSLDNVRNYCMKY